MPTGWTHRRFALPQIERHPPGGRNQQPAACGVIYSGMRYFLAKTDPETYSLDDLARERETTWDGVTNPQAVRAIREMAPGDCVFIYHSGGQAAVTGYAEVTSAPRPAPANPKLAVVSLAYRGRIEPPVTLAEIKQSGEFGEWALVRQGRLSTMAAPDAFVSWLRARRPGAKI